ncbi:MAG: histidine phosphatase family protein [Candidatus Thorarchaeota archaeon]
MVADIYFLRHGLTSIIPGIAPSKWPISDEGRRHASKIASSGIFDEIEVVVSSMEEKAYETAVPVSSRLGLPILTDPAFNELDRDRGGFMSLASYSDTVHRVLVEPSFEVSGWELSGAALERFQEGIDKMEKGHESENVLIVSHGIVLTLFFSHLLGLSDESPSRWDALGFCSWGLVRKRKVVRDIVVSNLTP